MRVPGVNACDFVPERTFFCGKHRTLPNVTDSSRRRKSRIYQIRELCESTSQKASPKKNGRNNWKSERPQLIFFSIHTRTYIDTYISHMSIHTHTYAQTHVHTDTNAKTHTHANIRTHTQNRTLTGVFQRKCVVTECYPFSLSS